MELSARAIKNLRNYIINNDVVYQRFGELMEVSNEIENRYSLLNDLKISCRVEIYDKGDQFIACDFVDIDNWSNEDDVLILLETIGTLICIPKQIAVDNNIIENAA